VITALGQLEADVICLQETWLPESADIDPLAEAAAKLGATTHRAVMIRPSSLTLAGVTRRSGAGELGIAILSTLPTSEYEVVDLGVAVADDVPRVAQVVSVTLADGTTARVVNTHLTHRLTSPRQLRRLQRRLRADGVGSGVLPTVIAGDLNMPRPFAALSLTYGTTVRGKTWPATRPFVQLDHILVNRRFRVLETAVLPPTGSDHLPVWAQLGVVAAA
jgi:endonuclease/exonuclease/phosphatase family metal-dependent hydrolase